MYVPHPIFGALVTWIDSNLLARTKEPPMGPHFCGPFPDLLYRVAFHQFWLSELSWFSVAGALTVSSARLSEVENRGRRQGAPRPAARRPRTRSPAVAKQSGHPAGKASQAPTAPRVPRDQNAPGRPSGCGAGLVYKARG